MTDEVSSEGVALLNPQRCVEVHAPRHAPCLAVYKEKVGASRLLAHRARQEGNPISFELRSAEGRYVGPGYAMSLSFRLEEGQGSVSIRDHNDAIPLAFWFFERTTRAVGVMSMQPSQNTMATSGTLYW